MDRRRAIYHPDLLRPLRASRTRPSELRRVAGNELELPNLTEPSGEVAPSRDPQDCHQKSSAAPITLNSNRAYEMLRASASLAVPLLCLAGKG